MAPERGLRAPQEHHGLVMGEHIIFGDSQLEIEHAEELAFYAAHIPLIEQSCTQRPVHVLERGIVEVLYFCHAQHAAR